MKRKNQLFIIRSTAQKAVPFIRNEKRFLISYNMHRNGELYGSDSD